MLTAHVYVASLLDLVKQRGVSTDTLFDGTGLSVAQLAASSHVDEGQLHEVMRRAHRLTNDPALAVHVGNALKITTHGTLGFAVLTAETLGVALRLMQRLLPIHLIAPEDGCESAAIDIDPAIAADELREFMVVAVALHVIRTIETLTGTAVPLTVELALRRPAYMDSVCGSLAGTWKFDQDRSLVRVPRSAIDLPLVFTDPTAFRLATEHGTRPLTERQRQRSVARVKELIQRKEGGFRSLEEVARQLNISARTLKRSLASYDTTYTELLEQLRHGRALELLTEPDVSLGAVALSLGYTDRTAFARAFRRWTGNSPGAYRRQQQRQERLPGPADEMR